MPPLQFQLEILIMTIRAQDTGGNAGGDNHSVAHGESLWSAVHPFPSLEVAPIEELHPIIRGITGAGQTAPECDCEEQSREPCFGFRFHKGAVDGRWKIHSCLGM